MTDRFSRQVTLRAKAKVGDEQLYVEMKVNEAAWTESPDLRKICQKSLRDALMQKILEKWSPVITVYTPSA
jgi:hypothetical protein